MRTWFTITNAAGEVATLSIFDEIGLWGITAADFQRELKSVAAPVINLEINSPGGSVFDGIAIYNMLRASGKTINAKVMGVAASIASVILMAADTITMPANAMVMVHAPSGGIFGTADEMRDMADVLDKVQANLVGVYMKRTGKTEDEITALLATDTWLTAAEAKDMGFADEVIDGVDAKASFDLERLPASARVVFKAVAQPAAKAGEPNVDMAKQELGEAVDLLSKLITGDTEANADAFNEVLDEVHAAVTYLNGGTPPAKEDDESDDKAPKNAKPFAEQVVALLVGTGFEANAAAWAARFTKPEEITARITECREITALYALAERAADVPAVITAGKTLAEARVALQTLLAASDVQIDTSKPANADATPTAPLSATGVYAKRKDTANSNQSTKQGPVVGKTADAWARRKQ